MASLDFPRLGEDSEQNDSDWATDSSEEEEDISEDEMSGPARMFQNTLIREPPLLPVPTDLKSPHDKLCDTCQALGLTAKRFVVFPNDSDAKKNASDNPGINLGLVSDILNKPWCPFCRLILVAVGGRDNIPTEENGEPTTISMGWDTVGPKGDPNQPWIYVPQIRIIRPYCQLASGGFPRGENKLNFAPEITLLANDVPSGTKEKTFFIRPISQEKIDFTLVKNWLHLCEEWHAEACDEVEMLDTVMHPASETRKFRLIDVVDHCLVYGETNSTYAALSYVWGQVQVLRTLNENVERLEQVGALLQPEFYDQIPLTVKDAIVATREIGLRYLWVDSLCIVQDDMTGEKADHISKMDLVYGSAFVTIIADTGDDANAGLPGVRPGTRNCHQPIEEIMSGLRLAFKPEMFSLSEVSAYDSRGWTYQESLFSRRTLRFIQGWVIFSCRRASQWREDVVFENETGIMGDLTMPQRENDIGRLEGLIQSYSARKFTFDSDIYSAFTGISKFISRELKSNLCHGIPEAFFDWSLLWEPLEDQVRREKAPSWSWSGWNGKSWSRIWNWYTGDMQRIRSAQRTRTWIIWYHRMAHNSTECRLVWSHNRQSAIGNPRNFYGGDIQHRFEIDCSVTRPTPKTLVGRGDHGYNGARYLHQPRLLTTVPDYFEDTLNPHPGSGFLQFWTVLVVFRLDTPTSPEDDTGPILPGIRYGIFGKSGKEIGTIYVGKSWETSLVLGEHDFIIVCEGRDERVEQGRSPDDEAGWKYKVMLIDWYGEWAERAAVGSIEKSGVHQALGQGPVWKEIILG